MNDAREAYLARALAQAMGLNQEVKVSRDLKDWAKTGDEEAILVGGEGHREYLHMTVKENEIIFKKMEVR